MTQNTVKMESEILKELQEIKQLLALNKKILTLDEFCTYSGISKSYAYQLTAGRKVKFYRPFGKAIYFDLDEVIEFLKQNPAEDGRGRQSKLNSHLITHL